MIRVLALTQFAFLSLGIVSLKIMIKAGGDSTTKPYLQWFDRHAFWLLFIPLVWVAFAGICSQKKQSPFASRLVQAIGVIVTVICFLFMAGITFLNNV